MSSTDEPQHDLDLDEEASIARISRGAVRIVSAYTGRGPTRVRTFLNEDLVTILFQDLLTTGERTLADHGRDEVVLEGRRAYQETMQAELVALVEVNIGRSVAAFLSANHLSPDVEIESFLLVRAA